MTSADFITEFPFLENARSAPTSRRTDRLALNVAIWGYDPYSARSEPSIFRRAPLDSAEAIAIHPSGAYKEPFP
jgi:hypothetical protein